MKQLFNKNLITLKCVLFCFLSGLGCILPFLPLHMLAAGLQRGEARLLSAVAPCVALLGPAVLCPLLDRLSVGRGSTGGGGGAGSGRLLRLMTAACLVLSAVFYLLLLTVPYTKRHEARRPDVLFLCDERGAVVMQEVCADGMRCNRWDGEKTGVLAVTACEYGCHDENMTWVTSRFPVTTTTTTLRPLYTSLLNDTAEPLIDEEGEDGDDYEMNPPHVCVGGTCHVYMQHARRLRLPLALLPAAAAPRDWCAYVTAAPSSCSVPPRRAAELTAAAAARAAGAAGAAGAESCRPAVRCLVLDPYDEPGGVLADAQCRRVDGDPVVTFWTYFIIRVLADIWPTAALALLSTSCVIATRETSLGRGDVGRQLAAGAAGLALLPPLAGWAADATPDNPFLWPAVMHAVFMVVGAAILLVDSSMPLSAPEWWWHTASGALALPMSAVRRYGAETAAVFGVVTLLGVFWSAIDAYLPWTFMLYPRTDGVKLGLTLTAGALPAALLLCWAEPLVDYVGHSNVFIAAFTLYALRFTALGFSTGYGWVLASEALETVTLSLALVTAVLYFRHLVPRRYSAAGQALPVIAHFCLGRCIGAIVGGIVTAAPEPLATQTVYRALAVTSLLVAAVYLAVYHAVIAPRCAAPAQPPPHALLQGLNSNGHSNGGYSPMRVYHEERARKGQFRY